MSELRYRVGLGAPNVHPDNFGLEVGECCVFNHAATGKPAIWIMAFRFIRSTDGKPETRHIPAAPGLPYAGGSAPWGLERAGANRWQISPSIQCWERVGGRDGKDVELWHETPAIVNVPEGEPWMKGI